MLNKVKKLTKSLFRLCGLDIRRLDQTVDNYNWLEKCNIASVLDIGANTGQFAEKIHKILPDVAIFSFEPLTDCYNELLNRMEYVPKFLAFNFALSNRNGRTKIYRNDHTPSSSLLPMKELHKREYPFTEHSTAQEIEIRCLDDIIDELNIDKNVLVKIDVQGTEDMVIRGGKKTISQARIIIIETSFQPLYSGQPLFEDIYNLLKPNFKYMGSWGKSRISQLDGSPLFEDSIFVNKSS